MTRIWMIEPELLCSFDPLNPKVSHLLGEHKEVHQLHGSIKKKISIDGYIDKRIVEPLSIKTRHMQLEAEIVKRGYNHKSPLNKLCNMSHLSSWQRNTKVSKIKSIWELMQRCPACRKRIINHLFEKHKRIIYNRANSWSRHKACNQNACLSNDDLISIGYEVFTICTNKWNYQKGQFSTFLWKSLDNRYHMETRNHKDHITKDIDDHPVFVGTNGDSVESETIFRQKLSMLSIDAQYVINSTIHTPMALVRHAISETGNGRITKRRIQRYLTDRMGWSIYDSWQVFDEIRNVLNL